MKNMVLTDLGHGDPFVLGQVLMKDTRLRSLLDPESTVVPLTSGQSTESLSRRSEPVANAMSEKLQLDGPFEHHHAPRPLYKPRRKKPLSRRDKTKTKGGLDVHKSSYLNPILLYPAKFAYQ